MTLWICRLHSIMKKYINSIVGSVLVIVAIVSIGAIAKADNFYDNNGQFNNGTNFSNGSIFSPWSSLWSNDAYNANNFYYNNSQMNTGTYVSNSNSNNVSSSSSWNNNTSNDDISQIYNLRVNSIQTSTTAGLPAVITATANGDFGCLSYDSQTSQTSRPCFINNTGSSYQLRVTNETILLLNNRTRASINQIMIGDKLNVFGFRDSNTNGVEALIIRDISQSNTSNSIQINNATVTSVSSAYLPATLTVVSGNGTQNVVVNSATILWNQNGAVIPFSNIMTGDRVNVSGFVNSNTVTAYTIREIGDFSDDRSLKITALDSLSVIQNNFTSISFQVSGGYDQAPYTITGDNTIPGMNFTRTPCAPNQLCTQVERSNQIVLQGTPTVAGTYRVTVNARDNAPVPPCSIPAYPGAPICMIAVAAPRTASQTFLVTVNSGTTSQQAPTITSISGPTSLRVGQAGLWSITGYDLAAGSITYSVRYGDELTYLTSSATGMFANPNNDSTATFSHAYNATGIYTLTFSAANSSNQVTNTTLTVNIIS